MLSSCQLNAGFKTSLKLAGKVFADDCHTPTTGRGNVNLVEQEKGAAATQTTLVASYDHVNDMSGISLHRSDVHLPCMPK